jgi:hypothetical protein
MKDYIILNRDKLIRTFKWTAIILTTAFCAWTYYKCDSANCFVGTDFTIGLILTLLIMPAFSVMLETVRNYIEYWRMEKFFDSNPMNELLKDGFRKNPTEKDSKWFLSKLSAVGQFDKFNMICEVENGRLRIIAKTNYDHLDTWDNKDIDSVLQSFRHVRFEYDGDGIVTSLKISEVKKMTYANLTEYLREFVKLLKKLKVE